MQGLGEDQARARQAGRAIVASMSTHLATPTTTAAVPALGGAATTTRVPTVPAPGGPGPMHPGPAVPVPGGAPTATRGTPGVAAPAAGSISGSPDRVGTGAAPPAVAGGIPGGFSLPNTGRPRPTALASRPSEELAAAARAGDDDAAGELYRRVRSKARRAARAFCAESDVDDAVAEGLATALRCIRQLRDPGAVEAWMVRCVVRCAIDLSRRRRRRPSTDSFEGIGECRLPTAASAADAALLAIERESMAAVVRTLQPSVRLLLYLRYDAGLSIQHIAAALGKPPGTIRRQCVEARRLAAARFLSGHLRPTVGACAGITTQLCRQPYRRPGARVRRRTAEHLRRCRACRDRQAELGTVLVELGHRPKGDR